MKKSLLFLICLCAALPSALSWGAKGHAIVAYIAECNLTPKARARIESRLGGHTLSYYSSWPDFVRKDPRYAYTETWHYANVDADETYDSMKKNPAGDVLTAVEHLVEELARGGLTPEQEELDLRLLIHLVGDLHQPMHAGRLSDLGGNLFPVKWFGRSSSLHAIWDDAIVEDARPWSYTEWQRELDRTTLARRRELETGTPRTWLLETVEHAAQLYKEIEPGAELSWDYLFRHTPLLEEQLLKAGYRLARLLNGIYS